MSVPKICPALEDAVLVHINSMLQTFPVRSEVDDYIGIDYSLLQDPVVTSRSLDLDFRVRDSRQRPYSLMIIMMMIMMMLLAGKIIWK